MEEVKPRLIGIKPIEKLTQEELTKLQVTIPRLKEIPVEYVYIIQYPSQEKTYVFDVELTTDDIGKLQDFDKSKYTQDSLIHFGTIFEKRTFPEGTIMQLCLPVDMQYNYGPVKTIYFKRIEGHSSNHSALTGFTGKPTPGNILFYTEVFAHTEQSIIYGKDPEWLNEYNTKNKKYYGTDSIRVMLIKPSTTLGGKPKRYRRKSRKNKKSRKSNKK